MSFFLELILRVELWVHLSSLLALSPLFLLSLYSLFSDIVHPSLTGLFSRDLISLILHLSGLHLHDIIPSFSEFSLTSTSKDLKYFWLPASEPSIGFLDSC